MSENEVVHAPAPEKTSAKPKKKESLVSMIFDYLEILVISISAVLMIFTLACRLCRVNGSSMRNTLTHGEMLVTTSLIEPQAGDIIVFHQTSEAYDRYNEPLVKRIIATEGQTIRIDYTKGEVYIDGQLIDEPYAALLNQSGKDIGRWTMTGIFEATVPEGCYFVMGDNRNNSSDSRSVEVGFVDTRRVLGKVIIRTNPYTVFD